MPKYFCEYCGIFLTHSSPWGRKQHSHGRKHINNKIEYYSQFIYEFQQNKYQHMMELATRLNNVPTMPNSLPPRAIPPMNPLPHPMQGLPPMQGFPPAIHPIPINPMGMPHMQALHQMPIPPPNQ